MSASSFLQSWLEPQGPEFPSIISIAIVLCVLFLVEGLYLFFRDSRRQTNKRMQERLNFIQEIEKNSPTDSLIKRELLPQTSFKQRLLLKISQIGNLESLLLQANVPLKASTYICICIAAGGLGGVYGFFHYGLKGAAVGAFLSGAFLPNSFLKFRKKRRLKKFEKQLPEALGLMARSLKAGHSFPSSMQLVADEMPNPIGLEFFKTFKEFNYGLDMNTALMNLYTRNELQDLKFFITAIVIQRETGGNLVEILEKIASLIRERFKLVNHIKAMTAEGRFSGLILTLLPPIVVLILYFINKDYVMLLINHPTGNKICFAAIFMQVLGMFVIRKIVDIKV